MNASTRVFAVLRTGWLGTAIEEYCESEAAAESLAMQLATTASFGTIYYVQRAWAVRIIVEDDPTTATS